MASRGRFAKRGTNRRTLRAPLYALALCIILPLSFSIQAVDSQAAREALDRAIAFSEEGDLQSARVEYMNAVKADPGWTEAYVRQAKNYLAMEDGLGAESAMKHAIESGLSQNDARPLMTHSIMMQGEYQRALKWLTDGPIPEADMAYGMRLLGRIHLALGNMAQAGDALNEAIALDENNSMLWTDIARFRFMGGEQGGAVDAVELALKIDPDNIRAIQFRGQLMRTQYGLATALPWFERALRIAPDNVGVLTEYAATLGDMGRMSDMLSVTRHIISLDPDNARAFQMQAVLAARAGKFQLAKTLLEKTGDTNQPLSLLVGGIVDFQVGNHNAAIEQFQRLLKIQPHNRTAKLLLARAIYGNGEYAQVIEQFGALADRADAEVYLLTLVGRSHEALGQRDRAATYLQRATYTGAPPVLPIAETDSVDTLALFNARNRGDARYGIAYVRKLLETGNNERALSEAKRLQRENPTVTDARILVGDVNMASGRPAEAFAEFAKAAEAKFSETVMVRMVAALQAQGRSREANEILSRFLTYNPANVTATRMLANDYIEVGNWDDAIILLRSARAKLGANDAMLMADLAFAEIRAGDIERAVTHAHTAYFVQPANPFATHVYGLALLEQGEDIEAAVQVLEKAIAITPGNGYLGYNLARAYLAAGRKQEAIAVLRKAVAGRAFPDKDKAVLLLNRLSA